MGLTDDAIDTALQELLQKNKEVAKTYQAPPPLKKALTLPRPGFLIISCSDPRMNPYKIFGIDGREKGRVVMIRNAGGRALDAIRTISVLQTLAGSGTVVVLHHTDCGMTHVTDAVVREAMVEMAPEQADVINKTQYGEITGPIEESVKHDVEFLRANPFIKPGTRIVGLAYDIITGLLTEVEDVRRV